jgi:MFS family permease
VNPNVVLPLGSSLLSFVFFVFLIDQWRERRRPYQLIWAIGMLWDALSAGTECLGGAFGWNEPLYRAWYLIGAIWVAGWLGLGTAFLLARTRFGYAFAASLLLAGLFTFLTQARYAYAGSGPAPVVYFAIAAAVAIAVAVATFRGDDRWPWLAAAVVIGGTFASAVMVALVRLPAPGWIVAADTHIPTGELFPGYIRLLTPFFNITGAFALVLGAIYSAYIFMPKRRVIRYDLRRDQPVSRFAINLLKAPVAIAVNLVASLATEIRDLLTGKLHSRVPATILIALGGLIPAITSGANRFGATSGFFVGEFLGVLFLFTGFLVSIEVFREIRIPFTGVVLQRRQPEASST